MFKDRDENAGMNILLKGLQILSQKNGVKQTGCINLTLEKGYKAVKGGARRALLSAQDPEQ